MRVRLRRCLISVLVSMIVLPALAVLNAPPAAAVSGFTAGDIVVTRVGDGSVFASGTAAPVFLDEYAPSGTLVQSVPLPAVTSGSNRRLTESISATSEGALALSQDGHYLTLAGYDAAPGTASVASSAAGTVNRVVARVDGAASVDTTTTISNAFSGNNVRGAVTDSGSNFWVAGATSGVQRVALGGTTSAAISTGTLVNLRTISITAGQLYASTSSGTPGVYAVGSGVPATGGQALTLVTGTGASTSPYAFAALDRDPGVPGIDTLYIADDTNAVGIRKYSFDGAAWTARGTFAPANKAVTGTVGTTGITGSVTGSAATLFGTTTDGQVVKVVDSAGFNATISASGTQLATAANNTAFRGVAFAPTLATVAPAITTQPQDTTITSGATATLSVT
ncbi:MAG TPA: DUF3616 domain-containing protein, partial [Pseudonocardiaceae bacterium]|nr:DUF3616 domain-containing protein [Pseudonocardiaceae bacterium]